jgi:NAD(P)-dependent dehydrogenase (short-subunit alcohol dehydrogenase family)
LPHKPMMPISAISTSSSTMPGIVGQGDGLPSSSSLDAIERAFRVNFLGSVAVTQAMLPLLRKVPTASIVNVSSGLGSLKKSGDPAWTHVAAKYLGYAASRLLSICSPSNSPTNCATLQSK